MANKYKKFVASAATATLVASAIVPVASANETVKFSDVKDSSEYAQYIYDLTEKKVMTGNGDKFNPTAEVTRTAAVKTLGKWLVNVHGYEVPADWNTKARFNDVAVDSKDEELVKYAALLKDLGIFTGNEAGNLNAKNTLNREQMAKVVVEAYSVIEGVQVVDLVADFESSLKDLSSVSAGNVNYVKVFEKYGITTVDTFNPKGKMQRQHFAKFLSIAINSEALAKDTAELAANPVVAALNAVTEAIKALPQVEDVTAETAEAATKAVETLTTAVETLTKVSASAELTDEEKAAVEEVIAEATELAKLVADKIAEVTATKLEIASVSALNNKEILVTFNKEVDKVSAETVANYTLSNGALGAVTPKLSDDKKSVILTVATEAAQQATTDVTVKNVKDTDGNVVTETKKTVTFLDTTLPTTTSVEVTGPKTLKVNFSEPLNTPPTFKLNGGAYSVTPVLAADGKSATLTLGAVLPTAEHTLEVSGGKDFAGFAIAKQELKFNYAADTVAPTAVVEKATETKVTLKFSKPVTTANLNGDVTAYHSINNSDNYKGTITAVNAVNGYADTFEVTFTTPIPAGTGKVLYLNTKENKFEDQWGNDVSSTKLTFDVVSDTVAPTVTKVEATGKDSLAQKELTLTLSEEVVKADAENRVNYILKDAQGNIVKTADYAGVDSKGNLVGATFAYDKAKNQVKVTLGTVLKAGNYKLEVANIKDVSFAGNKMSAQTVDFTITDKIAPTVAGITHDATNRAIYVNFSEAMNNADLADASNYFLLIDTASKELPTGSKVEVVSPQKVKISIPDNVAYPVSGDSVKVRVKGTVKDLAGNAIGGLFGESIGQAITWGTPSTFTIDPAANPLKLVAKNQLQFELPTELSAIDSEKFTFTGTVGSLNVASATYVNNSGKATVTVTLSGDLTVTDTTTITSLALANGALTNAEGLALTGTPSFGSGDVQDKLAAEIVSVETTAEKQITVTFSEAIPTGEIANASFAVAGNTVTAVNHSGKTVEITLKDAIGTDETPAVSQVLDIKDVAGNVLVAGTKVINTVDKLAPKLLSATVNSATSITLVFSEALEASKFEANNANGFTVAGGGALTKAELSTDGKSVILTGTDFVAVTTTVAYTQGTLEDKAKNALATISATPTVAP